MLLVMRLFITLAVEEAKRRNQKGVRATLSYCVPLRRHNRIARSSPERLITGPEFA